MSNVLDVMTTGTRANVPAPERAVELYQQKHRRVWSCARTFAMLFAIVTPSIVQAQSVYARQQLGGGLSIELPSHWTLLPVDARRNLRASAEAFDRLSGNNASPAVRIALLAANSSPRGAAVRVTLGRTSDNLSEQRLIGLTHDELREYTQNFRQQNAEREAVGGARLLSVAPVTVSRFNTSHALVISYTRAGVDGPSPWQVNQYKIPVGERTIELTLSYRTAEAVLWRPILEVVRRSLVIPSTTGREVAPEAARSAPWLTHRDERNGFAISHPSDWASSSAARTPNTKFVAVAPNGTGACNVMSRSDPATKARSQADLNRDLLESPIDEPAWREYLGPRVELVRVLESRRANIGNISTLQAEYESRLRISGEKQASLGLAALALTPGRQWILTCASYHDDRKRAAADHEPLKAIYRRVFSSFRSVP